MDPITAVLNLATQALKVVEKAIDGQPPDVRAQLWKWYIEDMREIRTFVKGKPQ